MQQNVIYRVPVVLVLRFLLDLSFWALCLQPSHRSGSLGENLHCVALSTSKTRKILEERFLYCYRSKTLKNWHYLGIMWRNQRLKSSAKFFRTWKVQLKFTFSSFFSFFNKARPPNWQHQLHFTTFPSDLNSSKNEKLGGLPRSDKSKMYVIKGEAY